MYEYVFLNTSIYYYLSIRHLILLIIIIIEFIIFSRFDIYYYAFGMITSQIYNIISWLSCLSACQYLNFKKP